jgi:hypothetical protein
MPPAVAEVYLKHNALALHDCADCGFAVPITPGGNGVPALRHFEACPLCGGPTGYAAYYLSRKAMEKTTLGGDSIKQSCAWHRTHRPRNNLTIASHCIYGLSHLH